MRHLPAEDSASFTWELAGDADAVHTLLCACDLHTATPRAPAPVRSSATTLRRVSEGAVHVLRGPEGLVASFTLTRDPPFQVDPAVFPPARSPAYLSRLAVSPAHLSRGAVVGAQCLRRAMEVASATGADAIRSEANPDLEATRMLLDLFGFVEYGQAADPDGRRRVYLQKQL